VSPNQSSLPEKKTGEEKEKNNPRRGGRRKGKAYIDEGKESLITSLQTAVCERRKHRQGREKGKTNR